MEAAAQSTQPTKNNEHNYANEPHDHYPLPPPPQAPQSDPRISERIELASLDVFKAGKPGLGESTGSKHFELLKLIYKRFWKKQFKNDPTSLNSSDARCFPHRCTGAGGQNVVVTVGGSGRSPLQGGEHSFLVVVARGRLSCSPLRVDKKQVPCRISESFGYPSFGSSGNASGWLGFPFRFGGAALAPVICVHRFWTL